MEKVQTYDVVDAACPICGTPLGEEELMDILGNPSAGGEVVECPECGAELDCSIFIEVRAEMPEGDDE